MEGNKIKPWEYALALVLALFALQVVLALLGAPQWYIQNSPFGK